MAADGARDPSLLAPRVVGTALEMRTRAYENLGKVPGLPATLPTPSSDLQTALVPSGERFPHTVIAVVTDSADAAVHHFLPLQLADARSVYTTWGWARQLGGVTMPAGVAPRLGAAAVDAADDEDLVLAPQDALALFAAVLSNGDAADPSDLLEPDTFTEEMHASIQAERAMLNPDVPADSLATIHEEYTVHPGGRRCLRGGLPALEPGDHTRRRGHDVILGLGARPRRHVGSLHAGGRARVRRDGGAVRPAEREERADQGPRGQEVAARSPRAVTITPMTTPTTTPTTRRPAASARRKDRP